MKSESSVSIIRMLRYLSRKPYDFALVAVRFGSIHQSLTEFIVANGDPETLLISNLNQMRTRGGEPIGIIQVRIRRTESEPEDLMQITLPFEQMFSLYQSVSLPQFQAARGEKAYLDSLAAECALALHAASLIRLMPPE